MSSLLIKIHKVHECLNMICDVESTLFNIGLFSIFKKKNYPKYEKNLQVEYHKLTALYNEIDIYFGKHSGVDQFILCSKEYISALLKSTNQLIIVNNRLSIKANKGDYTLKQYNEDLALFNKLQDEYCKLGDQMNIYYKLYANEIMDLN